MGIEIKIWEDTLFQDFDDHLVFHFEVPDCNDDVVYSVSVRIFWKNNEKDIYIIEDIYSTTPYVIYYVFDNGIIIKGTLEIKKFSSFNSRDTLGVFADFYYYKNETSNYIWHTEGFLISFASSTPIIEDIEVIDCIDEVDINATISINPRISSNTYSDLFPYMYLSGWPKITTSEQLWNFFYYKPFTQSPFIFTFPETLAILKEASDRPGMQTEAISFIEGKPPYESQYVSNVDALQGYIGDFKLLYYEVYKEKNRTLVVEQTCTFFNVDVCKFSEYLKSDAYLENKERLWESYFALIIEMGYENENLMSIIEVLTLCNFLEVVFDYLDSSEYCTILEQDALQSLINATIVLDKNIFPLPPYSSSPPMSSPPVSSPPTILPYAIGDLQLVKYKLKRYELGELASITSIMPGEKRKLVNRKLDRIIDKEISKIISKTDSFTTTQENNNDFNEELWDAIAETTETTNYPDPGLVSTYGPPTNITIAGEYTKTYTTQTPDKKQLSSFAKKVLNKTTQRLSEKINKVRAYTELKESEDTSVSLINNSKNREPVYGMYCWLNKVYQTEVINYGNRMLFSFIIPNPAKDYITQTEILNGTDLQEPKSLEDFKIYRYQDLTNDNYLEICQYYQLKKFPLYPQENVVVSDVVTLSQSKLIALPDVYYAKSATIEYAFGSGQTTTVVSGFLGENIFTFNQADALIGTKVFNQLNTEQGKIAVSAVYSPSIQMSPPNSEADFQMGVHISCDPLPDTILAWQIEIYQLLYNAYTEKITAYNLKIGASNTKKETVNPLAEQLIVKQELGKGIRKELLQNALEKQGLPLDMLNSDVSASIKYNQPEIIQYLNLALEWNEMSYTFFDEYHNQDDLFSVSSLSPDFFSAFLKATYARVIIPIPPEFNYGFLYFLNTGMVWASKDRLVPCFEDVNTDGTLNIDQLSIVYKLKKTFLYYTPLPKVVDAWEVLIPTSMQILQDKKTLKIE